MCIRDRGETALPSRCAVERDVHEHDVDTHTGWVGREGLRRLLETTHCADHLRKARRLEELDEVVASGPLVFDDEGAEG